MANSATEFHQASEYDSRNTAKKMWLGDPTPKTFSHDPRLRGVRIPVLAVLVREVTARGNEKRGIY